MDAIKHTAEYILSVNKFRNEIAEELRPSWIKMTTITILSSYEEDIDVELIKIVFHKLKKIRIHETWSPQYCEWTRKKTKFYNQISLTYQDPYSNKSIKISPNGTIHITGAYSLIDGERILGQLTFLLKKIMRWPEEKTYQTPRIVMINTNFSLNWTINQYKLIDKLSKNKTFDVEYDPAEYSAIKLKFKPLPDMKRVACNIFSTGNIIITGAQTVKEIAYAYKVLNSYLDASVRVAKRPEVDCKMHDVYLGGKFDDWVPLLRKMGYQEYQ